MIAMIYVNAQLTIGKSAGQTITESAIKGSVVVVKQSYQVKDKKTGKVYGRDGRKEFGLNYSLGVKTDAGFILTDAAARPWLEDDAFKKVEQTYEPFISQTEIRDIDGNDPAEFSSCPLKFGKQQPQGLWIGQTESIISNALEIDIKSGEKDGWLVWYKAEKNIATEPEAAITLQALSKKIEVKSEESDIEIDAPSNPDLTVGGIYVCPAFLGGGHVAYRLVGIVVKDGDAWKLRTPFVGFSYEKAATTKKQDETSPAEGKSQEGDGDVKLTPIEQDKDKDKNKDKDKKKKKK